MKNINNPYPSESTKIYICKKTNLSKFKVDGWFQRRRDEIINGTRNGTKSNVFKNLNIAINNNSIYKTNFLNEISDNSISNEITIKVDTEISKLIIH